MALQTSDLAMVGIGILGDAPSNPLQPPLVDGIHLRWTFDRELGFPWHGFYLFRRFHRPGPPNCLSDFIGSMSVPAAEWNAKHRKDSRHCGKCTSFDIHGLRPEYGCNTYSVLTATARFQSQRSRPTCPPCPAEVTARL